jgi:hypothetical protein
MLDRRELVVSAEAYTVDDFLNQDEPLTSLELGFLEAYHSCSRALFSAAIGSAALEDVRRVLTRAALGTLVVADLLPALPVVLVWRLHTVSNVQGRIELLSCLRSYLLSSLEERAARMLWGGLWGVIGAPRLSMPHARRPEASYEDSAYDSQLSYLKTYRAEPGGEGAVSEGDRFTLLCRFRRVDAVLEAANLGNLLCSSLLSFDGSAGSVNSTRVLLFLLVGLARNSSSASVQYLHAEVLLPAHIRIFASLGKHSGDLLELWLQFICEICCRCRDACKWISTQALDSVLGLEALEANAQRDKFEGAVVWSIRLLRVLIAGGLGLATIESYLGASELVVSSSSLCSGVGTDRIIESIRAEHQVTVATELFYLYEQTASLCLLHANPTLVKLLTPLYRSAVVFISSLFYPTLVAASAHFLATSTHARSVSTTPEMNLWRNRMITATNLRHYGPLINEPASLEVALHTIGAITFVETGCPLEQLELRIAVSRLISSAGATTPLQAVECLPVMSSLVSRGLLRWKISLLQQIYMIQTIHGLSVSPSVQITDIMKLYIQIIPEIRLRAFLSEALQVIVVYIMEAFDIEKRFRVSYFDIVAHIKDFSKAESIRKSIPKGVEYPLVEDSETLASFSIPADWHLRVLLQAHGDVLEAWLDVVTSDLFPSSPGISLFYIVTMPTLDHNMDKDSIDACSYCSAVEHFFSQLTAAEGQKFRSAALQHFFSSRKVIQKVKNSDEGTADILDKLIQVSLVQPLDAAIYASALAIFMCPLITDWRSRNKIWRQFGDLGLVHLLDSTMFTIYADKFQDGSEKGCPNLVSASFLRAANFLRCVDDKRLHVVLFGIRSTALSLLYKKRNDSSDLARLLESISGSDLSTEVLELYSVLCSR